MATSIRRRVHYGGRVQGVGFRYSVKQIASGFEVVGWVRNLADGRVELETSGEPGEVEAFLAAVRSGQLAAHIRQVEQVDLETPASGVTGFEIRR